MRAINKFEWGLKFFLKDKRKNKKQSQRAKNKFVFSLAELLKDKMDAQYQCKIAQQIEKHKRLIKNNQEHNEVLTRTFRMFSFMRDMSDKKEKTDTIIDFNKLHINHSNYMIRIFSLGRVSRENIKEIQVILKLMKVNCQGIEEKMRRLVELDYHTEQKYKEHMDNFMKEINQWEYFTNWFIERN